MIFHIAAVYSEIFRDGRKLSVNPATYYARTRQKNGGRIRGQPTKLRNVALEWEYR